MYAASPFTPRAREVSVPSALNIVAPLASATPPPPLSDLRSSTWPSLVYGPPYWLRAVSSKSGEDPLMALEKPLTTFPGISAFIPWGTPDACHHGSSLLQNGLCLTLSHPESFPTRTKLSTTGRTKGTVKRPVSAGVGLEGLKSLLKWADCAILCGCFFVAIEGHCSLCANSGWGAPPRGLPT